MTFLFFVYGIATLFSFFILGTILGAAFSKPVRTTLARATRRLRVLMFGWEFPPFNSGGLGVACLGIVRALSNKNVDITFVMPKKVPDANLNAKMISAGIQGITVQTFDSPATPYATTMSYARYSDGTPVYGADLVSEARRYADFGAEVAGLEPHDLIYVHDWLSFGAGKKAKDVSKKPLVAHVHSTEFDRVGGDGVDQAIYDLEREGMHEADRIIAVSGRTKKVIVDRYSVPEEKVQVVWNGIDDVTAPSPGETVGTRLAALKNAGYKIVLFMGRITIQKGPDYFIRAAKRVIDQDPHVLFVLAGSGDMQQQMMRLAASLGIADKMLFPGFLRGPEQYEAYASADLFVMPSVSEPFGLAALEAMRIGTPVIVSKQSGVAEAVKSALQVDFWDTDKMADLMLSVLKSPQLHAALSKEGASEAEHLTWDRSANEIYDLITDAAGVPANA